MKTTFLFLLVFFLSYSLSAAQNNATSVYNSDFTANCFEYYSEIPTTSVGTKEVFQYNSPFKDPIFIEGNYLLPTQYFSEKIQTYKYSSSQVQNFEHLNDQNKNTFIEIDTMNNKSLTVDFGRYISEKNLKFDFDYISKFHRAEYQISADGKKYTTIDKHDFSHFGFRYVRIKFVGDNYNKKEEKIFIHEFNFSNTTYAYMVQKHGSKKIQIYANNKCKNNFSNTSYQKKLASNIDTQKISSYFEENPSLVENPENDSDKDGILDKYDNCPLIKNPKQEDLNSNGIGDLCADDDRDGIYGDKDNCIYVYNPKQTDINQNKVGDLCEFDADKDGIFDSQDNCRNIKNPNQRDSDYDNIGDSCDNCKLYNPRQYDKNQNGVGDVCEKKEEKIVKNDDDEDGVINYIDNCRYITNPKQGDSDKDSIGDLCDNCPYLQNKKQVDLDENKVGDTCEDSDNDGIQGYLDNCMYISNADQKDDNNNGIGNLCEDEDNDRVVFIEDNCPYDYNPQQDDIDNDSIGDTCDEKDDRFIESNKTFFIILLVCITVLFGFGIMIMIQKIQK